MLGETSVRHRVKAMAKRRTLPVSILMQISKTTHVRFDVWPWPKCYKRCYDNWIFRKPCFLWVICQQGYENVIRYFSFQSQSALSLSISEQAFSRGSSGRVHRVGTLLSLFLKFVLVFLTWNHVFWNAFKLKEKRSVEYLCLELLSVIVNLPNSLAFEVLNTSCHLDFSYRKFLRPRMNVWANQIFVFPTRSRQMIWTALVRCINVRCINII